MTRRKLVVFYYGHDDFRYGVAEVFRAVLLGVDRSRFHVCLVYSGLLSETGVSHLPNVEIFQLNQSSLRKCIWPLFRLLHKLRPDIVMTGTEHPNILCAWIKLLLWHRPRLVLSVHSPLTTRFQEMWGKRESRLLKLLICLFYRCADRVVCVSNYVKRDLDRYACGSHTSVIYNPVVINLEPPGTRPATGKAKVLVVSRLVENKHIDDLIHLAKRDGIIERLDIIGDGPDRSKLEELVRKFDLDQQVFFHGYLDDPAVYYRSADVLVQPSRWEGFGNVIVEAMSYGCQVIVNRGAGGPVEIIEDGEYGFLYEQGDIDSLREALAASVSRPIPPMKLYSRATRFRPEQAIAAYETLFDQILE